ncbi:MAG: heme biosynthesis HemY N-terminal domain-containing protein, partial [Pseudomonadota bacterium]
MIRLLIFVLWVIFFAAALTALFSVRSTFPIEAFGWKMDVPAGLAAAVAIFLAASVALMTSMLKDLVGARKSARARKALDLREKGLAAITRGFEAIAIGDGPAARREADRATKALGGAPVTRLIAAQAAQLSGDDAAAGEALALMLSAPETEFLALRGLYAQSMRAGDVETARQYADRAFDRRTSARWAFDAVFDLALARLDYGAARSALERAAKSKAIDPAAADRALAATLTATAYAARLAGHEEAALDDADAALKRAPAFPPAAVLAARLHLARGDGKKAEKILTAAFAQAPARAIAETFEILFAKDDAAALDRLADRNPDSREASYLRAKAMLSRGDASAAVAALTQVLKTTASARALSMMALAQSALRGEVAARPWFERAAKAPP